MVGNILSLSSAHVFTYLFPLLTIPYLTRVLGPGGWGILAFYQAFAALAIQVIEFGFDWSATRKIARERTRAHLSEALGAVLGAKMALSAIIVAIAAGGAALLPPLRRDLVLLGAALFWATGQASNLNWFFQGVERMKVVAVLSILGKLAAVVGVFVFVRAPEDAWLVLALNGAAAWATAFVGLALASRGLDRIRFSLRSTKEFLTEGRTFFVFQSAIGVYTMGNSFILGLFAAPRVVGYFATAEKLIRLIVSFLDPIARALYPRMSHLVLTERARAARLVSTVTWISVGLAACAGLMTWLAAPFIIRVAVGPDYLPAVDVLRVLAVLPLLIAPGWMLGSQWMLPLGHERSYIRIVLAADLVDVCVVFLLAPGLGAEGMAVAVNLTEAFIACCVVVWLRRKDLSPFTMSATHLEPAR